MTMDERHRRVLEELDRALEHDEGATGQDMFGGDSTTSFRQWEDRNERLYSALPEWMLQVNRYWSSDVADCQ